MIFKYSEGALAGRLILLDLQNCAFLHAPYARLLADHLLLVSSQPVQLVLLLAHFRLLEFSDNVFLAFDVVQGAHWAPLLKLFEVIHLFHFSIAPYRLFDLLGALDPPALYLGF